MAKRATVSPRWLDSMLFQWGVRSLRMESRSLGYPSVCPMLQSGIPVGARSYEPEGVADYEHEELGMAIDELEPRYQLALIRAYKPWAAREAELELAKYSPSERTWRQWLHDAAELLAVVMRPRQPVQPFGCIV